MVVGGDRSAGIRSVGSTQFLEQRSEATMLCKSKGAPAREASPWLWRAAEAAALTSVSLPLLRLLLSPLLPFLCFPSDCCSEMKGNAAKAHMPGDRERQRDREQRSTLLISVPAGDDGKHETTAGNLRPPALGANWPFPDNSNIIMLPGGQQPLGI